MADRYADLSGREWTQQRIAAECLVSQQTVSYYIACVKLYHHGGKRPRFTEALNEIRGREPVSRDTCNKSVPPALDEVMI
jgi:hypothetical protein